MAVRILYDTPPVSFADSPLREGAKVFNQQSDKYEIPILQILRTLWG